MIRRLLVVVLAAAATLVLAAPASALQLGFNDEDMMQTPDSLGRGVDDAGLAAGLAAAHDAGATVWRIQMRWYDVAPTQPPSAAAAADPSWSGYQWAATDRKVRAVVAAGLTPVLWMSRAPTWAEGADRPAVSPYFPAGSWRPNAAALKPFATAIALRYRGDFPDPLTPGTTLPKVSTIQAWNEPNLYVELTPQYVKTSSGYVNASAGMFRALVNAVYHGVKSVAPADTVLAGATAPFGDYPDGGNRTPPAELWRKLLCITTLASGPAAINPKCPKIHFDAYAHNPYSPWAPTRKASNADDVTVPDIAKVTSLVKAAVTAGVVRPHAAKPLWITEVSWDSLPDPNALTPSLQASYEQGAISVLANEGAQYVLFWNSRDDAPVPDYDSTYQSGIFTRGATPSADVKKPSWTAFHFPFTAYRDHGRTALWGKAPTAGGVVIQRSSGSGWNNYLKVTAGNDGVFSKKVRTTSTAKLRAVQGTFVSLVGTTR